MLDQKILCRMIESSDYELEEKSKESYILLKKILMLRKNTFMPEMNKLSKIDKSIWNGFSSKEDLINWMEKRTQTLEGLALILEQFVDPNIIRSFSDKE